ncbi:MAG TPA: DNA cytosine methyltransferase, partial [Caulobacteraceae bacterium]
MSRPPHTFYEFFAGGGMARLGLGAGWDCLFANDFDPVKTRTYRANFGEADIVEGDVWALSPKDLPGHADLAWASSPCQDFSLAGGRAGLKGGRSSAFFGFWRLVEGLAAADRAPRIVVIENVVGLLSSHGGDDFTALCQALGDQGYAFGAIEADAASFLPQSRRRILVIACREPPAHLPRGRETRPGLATAFERLPPALKSLWIGWPQPEPGRRNTDLAALLEPDEAVSWHTGQATTHILSLLDDRNRAKVQAARDAGQRQVGAIYRRTRAGR